MRRTSSATVSGNEINRHSDHHAGGGIVLYYFAGLYDVAIAAARMMATTAMQLAIDAFGPIANNAGGIAEMSQLPPGSRTNR